VLPARYELCAVEDMVILIADMISELIETNDNLPLRDVVLTRFHSRFVYLLVTCSFHAYIFLGHRQGSLSSTISNV
jgi:hypothetical protein